ncbi:MAG: hypothetical protein IT250_10210 [Chitinophagaceae bacterium]|nr:hypothetical protein [Chitinophagaceae bacterium]
MPFPQTDIDKYILNAVVMSAEKNVPFDFDTIISRVKNILPGPPFDGGESFEAHVFSQLNMIHIAGVSAFRQLLLLVQEGYLKKLSDGSGHYMLTEKGEEVKKIGSIEEYKKKKRWNDNMSKMKDIIVTFLFPILTIYFAAMQTCNNKIEIAKPVNVILDSTLKVNMTNQNFSNTCNQKGDSSKIKKIKD